MFCFVNHGDATHTLCNFERSETNFCIFRMNFKKLFFFSYYGKLIFKVSNFLCGSGNFVGIFPNYGVITWLTIGQNQLFSGLKDFVIAESSLLMSPALASCIENVLGALVKWLTYLHFPNFPKFLDITLKFLVFQLMHRPENELLPFLMKWLIELCVTIDEEIENVF